MSLDENFRIDRIHGTQGPEANQPGGAAGAAGSTEFRRLLEQLETVARSANGSPESVTDIDNLREAMKKADDDFEAVMQLRKQLEDAYRDTQK